ncbi:hypothetical protein [Pseudonocardia autotrophica]|uniref:hypothetical protein n=1 Tax=Pseudonocardia autotrophica TaxID=2074 RepID=UPI000E3340B5|nr:hypothetical protein [Pseudonocardia autotrophica]BBG00335.1 hypothetical protein Pdca_15440 [Pseudonocardia autotrophica]
MALVVVAASIAGLVLTPATGGELIVAAALTVSFIVHVELSLHAERVRRTVAETRYCDLSSVWTFAAALALPLPLAIGLLIISYSHLYWRVCRPSGVPSYREGYSGATVVLAMGAVSAVRWATGLDGNYASTFGAAVIVACVVVYAATNTILVVLAIRLSQPGSRFMAILRGGDLELELATLSLGAIVAAAILPSAGFVIPLVFVVLLVLERTTLVRELKERVQTDTKTGLLN